MLSVEGSAECFEVIGVAGEDRFGQSSCHGDEMSVDDVGAARAGEQGANSRSVVERIDHNRVQEPSEARLAGTISPHLRDDRMCCRQRRVVNQRRGQERLCRRLTSVD